MIERDLVIGKAKAYPVIGADRKEKTTTGSWLKFIFDAGQAMS